MTFISACGSIIGMEKSNRLKDFFKKNKIVISVIILFLIAVLLIFTNVLNLVYFDNPVFNQYDGELFNDFFPLGTKYEITDEENPEWQVRIVQAVVEEYVEEDTYSYIRISYSTGSLEGDDFENRTAKVLLTSQSKFWDEYTENNSIAVDFVNSELTDGFIMFFDSWEDEVSYQIIGLDVESKIISKYDVETFKEVFPKDSFISFRVLAYYPEEDLDSGDCFIYSVNECLSAKYFFENNGYEDLFGDKSSEVLLIPLSGFILEIL